MQRCNVMIAFFFVLWISFGLAAQTRIELWHADEVPGLIDPSDEPYLTWYPVSSPADSATAVVVCPGGGYTHLAEDHEGKQVAEWLNKLGVAAFVLHYRVGTQDGQKNLYPIPFDDGERAMRLVRSESQKFHIHPERIGILGFSAGGHLASTVGTHFDNGDPYSPDRVEQITSRPNFMILIYPVISFKTEFCHRGSRQALLGMNPDLHLVHFLSNETQVTTLTPPTFLVATDADRSVPVENSLLFYEALRKARVPAELHVYQKGGHGFGLAPDDVVLSTWPKHCADWMRGMGLLPE